ncbi:solute carrier family 22 member 3-like [Clytia hemisphaerica]|uniref:solute carrier family 22 member 3-like n=1 Tax=Clytia hemisphaerica TaxID=252671 RepID=UPI0034D3A5A2
MIVQYNLDCDRSWLINLSTSMIFIGGLFGSIILNWLSDNFGRKKVTFISFFMILFTKLLSAYMPDSSLFITLRFLTGFFVGGIGSFVMITEVTGEKWRPFAGNLLWIFYAIALCILPLKAYFIDSWKVLVVVCSAPYLILLLTYRLVPESVRWLRLKGKSEEAVNIFKRMAKWNGKELDPALQLSKGNASKEMSSPLDLFRPKKVAINTFIFIFGCYTNALVYYGISLAADDIGVDSIYLSFFLVSLVEFPANFLATYCCNRFGRRNSSSIPLVIAGLLTLSISFTSTKVIRICLGMLGKLFVTLSFDAIATLLVEVYPTNIRSEAFGIINIAVYIGGASAPWVAKGFLKVLPGLPFIVMGVLGIVAGFVNHFLPETKGVEMKESIEETEAHAQEINDIELQ